MLSKASLGDIWRTNRVNEYTRIISVNDELIRDEKELSQKFLEEFDKADVRSLLFSKGAVFVEGPSDKFVVELLESKLMQEGKGMGLYENDWTVVRLDSKNNAEKYMKFAEVLALDYAFLLDRDAEEYVKKILKKKGIQDSGEDNLQRNGFFLLPSDLDHLLGFKGNGKPLKALSKMLEMKVEKIPEPLINFTDFVRKRICSAEN
jgi:predicted ATP-dependent endonuclease of OLD family